MSLAPFLGSLVLLLEDIRGDGAPEDEADLDLPAPVIQLATFDHSVAPDPSKLRPRRAVRHVVTLLAAESATGEGRHFDR
jgi:hypothetical protein